MKLMIQRLLLFGLLLIGTAPQVRALELGACESERNKMIYILKNVFKPYLKNHTELPGLRDDIIGLANSLTGWVEDIDQCYRTVFQHYDAPIDNPSLNNGLDWSAQLVAFNDVIQNAGRQLQDADIDSTTWRMLDNDLQQLMPNIFLPNYSYEAVVADGGYN